MVKKKQDLLLDYLVHSVTYYCADNNLISDHEFDQLCLRIIREWDTIESPFKEFVLEKQHNDVSSIKGLSLFWDEYPKEVLHEARRRMVAAGIA